MAIKALVSFGNRAYPVANDVHNRSAYRAEAKILPPEVMIASRVEASDTLLFVERGLLEVMVDGAAAFVRKGDFVRVKAGSTYGYRNAGSDIARVLTAPETAVEPAPSAGMITIRCAVAA
jgi:mannose-6-phosphate isomerase-like protein (cupin superfamily)